MSTWPETLHARTWTDDTAEHWLAGYFAVCCYRGHRYRATHCAVCHKPRWRK